MEKGGPGQMTCSRLGPSLLQRDVGNELADVCGGRRSASWRLPSCLLCVFHPPGVTACVPPSLLLQPLFGLCPNTTTSDYAGKNPLSPSLKRTRPSHPVGFASSRLSRGHRLLPCTTPSLPSTIIGVLVTSSTAPHRVEGLPARNHHQLHRASSALRRLPPLLHTCAPLL